jgi:hypothetical protein
MICGAVARNADRSVARRAPCCGSVSAHGRHGAVAARLRSVVSLESHGALGHQHASRNRAVMFAKIALTSRASRYGPGLNHHPTTAGLLFSDLPNLVAVRRLCVELQCFVIPLELRDCFSRLIISRRLLPRCLPLLADASSDAASLSSL